MVAAEKVRQEDQLLGASVAQSVAKTIVDRFPEGPGAATIFIVPVAPALSDMQDVIVEGLETLYEDGLLHDVGRTVLSKIDDSVGVLVEEVLDDGTPIPDYEAKTEFKNLTGHVLMVSAPDESCPRYSICVFMRVDPEIDLEALNVVTTEIRIIAGQVPRSVPAPNL